jgi:hypothetical protein
MQGQYQGKKNNQSELGAINCQRQQRSERDAKPDQLKLNVDGLGVKAEWAFQLFSF